MHSGATQSAFDVCSQAALTHYENFPVGSKFIRKDVRPHVHAVYAFARAADDFADEKEYEGNDWNILAFGEKSYWLPIKAKPKIRFL